ncbi:MAG: hypothetical protein V1662_00460, partial [Candidatus Omnitrophota bacterium]
QSVSIENGTFTVTLGIVTPLNLAFDSEYWLSVQIKNDTQMRPRQRMTSVGYSINADKLDNIASNQFLRSDTNGSASGQITLSYPGTALVVQPSSAPGANTKLIEIKDAAGVSKCYIDSEGDFNSQNAAVNGQFNVSGTATIDNSLTVGNNVLKVDTTTGYIGIGTATPQKTLDVAGDADILGNLAVGSAEAPRNIVVTGDLNVTGNQIIEGATTYAGNLTIGTDGEGYAVTFYSDTAGKYLSWDNANATMTFAGGSNLDVGGSVDVDGDLHLQGRIRQGALGDLAEMMPLASCVIHPPSIQLGKKEVLIGSLDEQVRIENKNKYFEYLFARPEPADVVVISPEGGVHRCFKPLAKNTAGIVSTNPAQILHDALKNAVPIALSGIVPCKVTNENGIICPGDLLTSSSLPGHAMKAPDNAQPGTIVGKALEKFEGQSGIIDVLVIMH